MRGADPYYLWDTASSSGKRAPPFREEIYRTLKEHEEDYEKALVKHIGHHLICSVLSGSSIREVSVPGRMKYSNLRSSNGPEYANPSGRCFSKMSGRPGDYDVELHTKDPPGEQRRHRAIV